MKDNIFIIIPAFNEATVIGQVVASLATFGRAIVIDDGSRDDTASVASSAKAIVLRHPINLGQGAALQTGIEYAFRQGAEFIVTFDADGQHDPNDIPNLLKLLKASNADIVLGSRFLGATIDLNSSRRLLLKAARLFTTFTTGITTTDVHNGFRILSRNAAKKIKLTQNRMAHASEFMSQIKQNNLSFVEGPVTIRYTPYSLAKGQRNSAIFTILFELFTGFLRR